MRGQLAGCHRPRRLLAPICSAKAAVVAQLVVAPLAALHEHRRVFPEEQKECCDDSSRRPGSDQPCRAPQALGRDSLGHGLYVDTRLGSPGDLLLLATHVDGGTGRDALPVLDGRGGSEPLTSEEASVLPISPDINFFSYRSLLRALRDAGFSAESYRGQTFVWGAYVITTSRAIRWNPAIGDRLPPQAISDWMLVPRPSGPPKRAAGYLRGALEGLRRRLYDRHWGIR